MNRLWKSLQTNMMYWRFRYITRNRLRLQSWYHRRRPATRQPTTAYRPRGTASAVLQRSPKRTWAILLAMVVLLTTLTALVHHVVINPTLVYGIGALIVVAAVYLALRGA
jgi:hypothetical protein